MGMFLNAFNFNIMEAKAGGCLSSRPVWLIE